jgi:hypothetical protein
MDRTISNAADAVGQQDTMRDAARALDGISDHPAVVRRTASLRAVVEAHHG